MNCSFRWNLAYADAYADLLWEENTVCSLKSTTEVVLKNRAKVFVIITVVADRSLLLYAWWMKSVTELIQK